MKTFVNRPVASFEELHVSTIWTNPTLFERWFKGKKPEPIFRNVLSGRTTWSPCIVKFVGEELDFDWSDPMKWKKIPSLVVEDVTLTGVFPSQIIEEGIGYKVYMLRFDTAVSIIDELKKDY